MPYDVITLAQKLISFPSITPEDAGALDYLAEKLEALGFTCYFLPFGEGAEMVPNLFARIGTGAPHICYAGHTDVVPPGPLSLWTYGPFDGHIEDGILYGRGASDMKGSVAAFLAAVSSFLEKNEPGGSISFLITGDEEGPSVNGTVKVLEWMEENGHIPDVCLVGEPSNPDKLGQEIKIGRRGSLNGVLSVTGRQGHVAYPEKADNPLPRLITLLGALSGHVFDEGSALFPRTNLEITAIHVDNKAENVIPDSGRAMFNIRFNDLWSSETLEETVRALLDATGCGYSLRATCNAESFITPPGSWPDIVQKSVCDVTGDTPALTTGGGTSDARFVARYCPVVEFGGINKTIHQINENAAVEDLRTLVRIFEHILGKVAARL